MICFHRTKEDRAEAERLRAEPWMLDALKLNPSYCDWGVGQDAMQTALPGTETQWGDSLRVESWAGLNLGLDDLNEVVNFYFGIERDSKPCDGCDGDGYSPAAKALNGSFYDDGRGPHSGWGFHLDDDDVRALAKARRLYEFGLERWDPAAVCWRPTGMYLPAAEEVNAYFRAAAGALGHDGINRHALVRARCRRADVDVRCAVCAGAGGAHTSDTARLVLALWVLHPRKGLSLGIEIKSVSRAELPSVLAYLETAAKRNAKRLARAARASRKARREMEELAAEAPDAS